MEEGSTLRMPWAWGLVAGWWTLNAVSETTQLHARMAAAGQPVPWREAAPTWCSWTCRCPRDEVDYFRAETNYVRLHEGRASHLVRDTLAGLEARLDPARFLRIHRSLIVNLARIREVEPLFAGERVLTLGTAPAPDPRRFIPRIRRFAPGGPPLVPQPSTRSRSLILLRRAADAARRGTIDTERDRMQRQGAGQERGMLGSGGRRPFNPRPEEVP